MMRRIDRSKKVKEIMLQLLKYSRLTIKKMARALNTYEITVKNILDKLIADGIVGFIEVSINKKRNKETYKEFFLTKIGKLTFVENFPGIIATAGIKTTAN